MFSCILKFVFIFLSFYDDFYVLFHVYLFWSFCASHSVASPYFLFHFYVPNSCLIPNVFILRGSEYSFSLCSCILKFMFPRERLDKRNCFPMFCLEHFLKTEQKSYTLVHGHMVPSWIEKSQLWVRSFSKVVFGYCTVYMLEAKNCKRHK